jgi:RNA polymerase sigma-70 factor (ECF subfamily)
MDWNKKDFKLFFLDFHPVLYAFTCKFLGNDAAAKDIVQDAFIYLWDKRSRIQSIPSAKSYLYKHVQNRSLNYIRDNKFLTNTVEENKLSDNSFQQAVIESETYNLLYKEIRKLSSQEQKVIELSLSGKN